MNLVSNVHVADVDHQCTKAECGHDCHFEPNLGYVRSISVSFGDAGTIDADDQPCGCEAHTE